MPRRRASKKAAPKPTNKAPRYTYIGPAGPSVTFPGLNLVFRPAKITDAQVTNLLHRHPQLTHYFRDAAAEEE